MARQVDYQTVVDNFWELANLVKEGSKVILTSRTEYFRWAKESEKILGGEEFGRRTILLSPPKFEVLYLEPFNNDQIRQIITLRLGAKDGPSKAERILKNQNLAEMARKPVLVELLLAALDEVSDDILENQAKVYLYATNKLLLRNIDTKRTFTKTADKLYFLCELAWEMIKSGELRIHYISIPERIKAYFGERIKDQHELDTWDFDLRNQTLLHRNAAGYYEFAHKSLAEYFVALKFAAELGCLAPEFTKTYCESEGKPCDIPMEQKEVTGLAETFGALVLNDERMRTIWNLFQEMMAKDSSKQLWKVIDETRGKTEENVKYAGGNAATLLSIKRESFKGVNLERTVLIGADLSNKNLTGANFQGACLRKASLINSILDHSNFCLADLQDIEVGERHHVSRLIWSNSGLFLAGFRDSALIIWNVQNNQEELNLPKIPHYGLDQTTQFVPYEDRLLYAEGKKLMAAILKNGNWEIETEKEFEQRIGCIALNSDGNLLAVLQENRIIIWNRQTQKEHRIIKGEDDTHCLLFIPNSSLLLAAHSGGGGERRVVGPGFKLWDIELDKVIHTCDNTGHSWTRSDFFTDKLGHILVTGAFDMNLTIWSLPSFNITKQIAKVGEYFAGSNSIACSPDGTTIATANIKLMNGEIKDIKEIIFQLVLIDVDSGRIKSLNYSSYISSLAFSADGSYMASVGRNGEVCILDVNSASPTFAQCLKVLEKKMSCHGMLISGARGLEQEITLWENGKERKSMLLELFADCGAILDEEQKRNLKEMRK